MIEMKVDHINESNITSEYGCAFIYRLMKDNEVVYVGQTKNIKTRMQQHTSSEKDFDLVQFYPCEVSSSTRIERDEILRFRPVLNKGLPKTDKYITLRQAATTTGKAVSERMFSYLDIVFEGSKDKIAGRTYVLASEVDKKAKLLIGLIDAESKKISRGTK